MKKLILLSVLIISLAACQKQNEFPDHMSVTINESANITFKVVDNSGNNMSGALVRIYSSLETGGVIFTGTTNASGECNAGKLLQGQYEYNVTATQGNMEFQINELFQVISGENKVIRSNPFSNTGSLEITIEDYYYNPLVNINVALIPHSHYSNDVYDFNSLLDESYFIGITDTEGKVHFEGVPAGDYLGGRSYSVLVYHNSSEYDYPYSSIYATKDIERKYSVQVDL